MEQFFTLVGDLGLPIAGTIGLGAFIYIIIKYILSSVVGSITFMDNVITQLDNRVKTMNNDIIQIDQLINQIPSSFQSQTLNESKFDNLDFMTAIGEKFISEVNINFSTNIAIITIKEIPQTQYKLIKNISDRFNISVLKEDVQISDNTISGKISIKLDDE